MDATTANPLPDAEKVADSSLIDKLYTIWTEVKYLLMERLDSTVMLVYEPMNGDKWWSEEGRALYLCAHFGEYLRTMFLAAPRRITMLVGCLLLNEIPVMLRYRPDTNSV